MLDPSGQRVLEIDQRLRTRLAGSLDYLASFLTSSEQTTARAVQDRLIGRAVSPLVFGSYAALVQDISRDRMNEARDQFRLMALATELPAKQGLIGLGDGTLTEEYWGTALALFDTDPDRSFLPVRPALEDMDAMRGGIAAAMGLIAASDPELAAEMGLLQRMTILASPPESQNANSFNGASTFFLWGSILLNARLRRSVAEMVDVLVHEASHLLLFGLVDGGALSENDPAERYASPLRSDPRPIDGIFHACFVATRVNLAISRMLSTGRLPPKHIADFVRRAEANAQAAQSALDLLRDNLRPTPAGKRIFLSLDEYWQTVNAVPS